MLIRFFALHRYVSTSSVHHGGRSKPSVSVITLRPSQPTPFIVRQEKQYGIIRFDLGGACFRCDAEMNDVSIATHIWLAPHMAMCFGAKAAGQGTNISEAGKQWSLAVILKIYLTFILTKVHTMIPFSLFIL